ncbi:ketosteroid isomerase-related protein [Deinococcus hopiensis]|uniref:SnoaL-like domain-containing protein n=1 Tax=Deinococcus hopiensis KR-140 TaxID=695939 RepID=A0A1W1VSQ5_9DEIO|nr:ketosteroid isomerase-related protein [Deinococcus hopiensis]SMB95914.1 conserved hypothetical protein, steroid delta-isomerase-related [Deinococcus hopiensis KR-140]
MTLPTSQSGALRLVEQYYAAFNAGDAQGMLALLTPDVRHDINEGGREVGVEAFRAFLTRMDAHYRERVEDLAVMVNGDSTRAAAEFTIHGEYLSTDPGLPEAHGQRYALPVGAFFEIREGRIARVTNYYNLAEWSRQVRGDHVPEEGA